MELFTLFGYAYFISYQVGVLLALRVCYRRHCSSFLNFPRGESLRGIPGQTRSGKHLFTVRRFVAPFEGVRKQLRYPFYKVNVSVNRFTALENRFRLRLQNVFSRCGNY